MGWLNKWDQYVKNHNIPTLAVIIAFAVFAATSYLYAYVIEGRGDFVGFTLSLAVELTGIFLTFIAVNIVIQNAKDRDDLESMSMEFIHRIDYLVWVWLGGERIFDLKELNSLLDKVDSGDKLETDTQNLALSLGNDAFEYKRTKKKYIEKDENFDSALEKLAKLAKIRDTKSIHPVKEVAQPLQEALQHFTRIVEINFDSNVEKIVKDSSKENQEWRYKGKIVETNSKINLG